MKLIIPKLCFKAFITLYILSSLSYGCADSEKAKEKLLAEHQSRARQHLESGNVQNAEIELKNIIKLNPANSEAHYELGETRLKKGEVTDALKSYWQAVRHDRENLKAILKLGRLYLSANRTRDARTAVTMLLEKVPDNIDVLTLLAGVQIQERQLNEALQTLRKAISLYPDHLDAYLTLGRLHLMFGELEQADAAFLKAAALHPPLEELIIPPGKKYRTKPVLTQYYEIAKEWDAAEKIYQEAVVRTKEGNIAPLMELANFYIRRGAFDSAFSTLNKALSVKKNDVKIRIKMANLHYYFKKFEDAEAIVDEILKDYNWYTEANFLKGKLLQHRKEYTEALERFDRVINDSPRLAEAHYHKGVCLMKIRKIEEAQMALRESVELNPFMVDARLMLAKSYLRDYKTASTSLAAAQLSAVLEQVPDHKEALMLQGRVNLDIKDMDGAEKAIKKVLNKYPDYSDAHFRLGLVYFQTRRNTDALKAFRKALDLNPHHIDSLRFIVGIYKQNKSFDKALNICNSTERKVKDRPLVVAAIEDQIGKIYFTMGEVNKAKTHLKKAIDLDINLVSSHMALTRIYMQEKKINQVITHFEEALIQNPKLIAGYMVLGGVYERMGEKEEAEKLYRRVLEIKEDFAPAANNLAYNLAQRRIKLNEAMQFAEIAKEKRPDDPVVLDTLGWVYHLLGLYAKAIPHLTKSVERMPENPLFHYHLGKAYHENDQREMAKISLQKVLALDPNFMEADDIRNILKSYRTLG